MMCIRHLSKMIRYGLPLTLLTIIVFVMLPHRTHTTAPSLPTPNQTIFVLKRTTIVTAQASSVFVAQGSCVKQCAPPCILIIQRTLYMPAPTPPSEQDSLRWSLLLLTGVNAMLLLLDAGLGQAVQHLRQVYRLHHRHNKKRAGALLHTVSVIGQAVIMLLLQLLQM